MRSYKDKKLLCPYWKTLYDAASDIICDVICDVIYEVIYDVVFYHRFQLKNHTKQLHVADRGFSIIIFRFSQHSAYQHVHAGAVIYAPRPLAAALEGQRQRHRGKFCVID